jgi:DNA-binding CsgD family transcriptional regulator
LTQDIQVRFDLINDLVGFLNNPSLKVEDITKYLTLKTFHLYGAYSVYIYKLNTDANLELVNNFGQDEEMNAGWRIVPLSHNLPATDAVKEDRMVWLADHRDWEEFYPHLIEYPDSAGLKTLINFPLHITSAPIGVLGIMCENENKATPEDNSFVSIVSGLISLHISKQQNRAAQLEERGAYLTKRQIAIIEMMSQQMTNIQIARELGYSESTVRHESMRIYEILQANGRREAVVLARKLGLIK